MRLAVIFGSRATEHDVSIASAYGIMQCLLKLGTYEIFPIYITKAGKWIYEPAFLQIKQLKELLDKDYTGYQTSIDTTAIGTFTFHQKKKSGLLARTETIVCDCAFPMLHGKNGEDGTVQGVCELLDIPYVSPNVLGSALGINKIAMKDIFKANDLPITAYKAFVQGEENIDEIETLGYPLIIKPASLGSSIGITKVANRQELQDALEVAFHYDHEVICEALVHNLVELNCSFLIDHGQVIHSFVEQPMPKSDFLSFEEKYINDGGSMQGVKSKVKIPADIPAHVEEQIVVLMPRIAQVLHIDAGAPRVDFLRDSKADNLYVNEINTIPGAMQLHLWMASGMSSNEFLTKLIDQAVSRHQRLATKTTSFNSSIIDVTVNFRK